MAHHFKEQKFVFQVISNSVWFMHAFPVQILGKNECKFQLVFYLQKEKTET